LNVWIIIINLFYKLSLHIVTWIMKRPDPTSTINSLFVILSHLAGIP